MLPSNPSVHTSDVDTSFGSGIIAEDISEQSVIKFDVPAKTPISTAVEGKASTSSAIASTSTQSGPVVKKKVRRIIPTQVPKMPTFEENEPLSVTEEVVDLTDEPEAVLTETQKMEIHIRHELSSGSGSRQQRLSKLKRKLQANVNELIKLSKEDYIVQEEDYIPKENVKFANEMIEVGKSLVKAGEECQTFGRTIFQEQAILKSSKEKSLVTVQKAPSIKQEPKDDQLQASVAAVPLNPPANPTSGDSEVTEKKKFECLYCTASFQSKYLLRQHFPKHTGTQYLCVQLDCTFSAVNERALKVHAKIHQVGKKFKCKLCKDTFTRASSLYNHQRVHTGATNKCSIKDCGLTFKSVAMYQQHMKYFHSEGKTIPCTVCEDLFKTPSDMLSHLNKIHGVLKNK